MSDGSRRINDTNEDLSNPANGSSVSFETPGGNHTRDEHSAPEEQSGGNDHHGSEVIPQSVGPAWTARAGASEDVVASTIPLPPIGSDEAAVLEESDEHNESEEHDGVPEHQRSDQHERADEPEEPETPSPRFIEQNLWKTEKGIGSQKVNVKASH